jgi:cytochrome c oxidase subunit 1
VFNFDEVPTVVAGPYEYGQPGVVHAVFKEKEPTTAGAVPAPAGGGGAPPPVDG